MVYYIKGGAIMNKHKLDVRKENILKILKRDKNTTIANIAHELSVSYRSIGIDVSYLKNAMPEITTKRGKYEGGIFYKKEGV